MKILNSFGSINPELADDKISINKKLNSLGSINPEHADDEISVNNKVNCLGWVRLGRLSDYGPTHLDLYASRSVKI